MREQVEASKRAQAEEQRAAVAQWSRAAASGECERGNAAWSAGEEASEEDIAPSGPLDAAMSRASAFAERDAALAPPRPPVRITVTHTPLERPELPAREPCHEDDNGMHDPVVGKASQRRNLALRCAPAAGAVSLACEAVDASERHPAFLCDKGDAFLSAGAWEAARNAFSAALQLMTAPDNTPRCRALRGRALCLRRLGDDAGAVRDLEAAAACADSAAARTAIDADLAAARADAEAPAEALRQRGDSAATAGDVDTALGMYQRALERTSACTDADADALRVRIAALGNRASLWLSQGQLAAAAVDVEDALGLLLGPDELGNATLAHILADDTAELPAGVTRGGGVATLARLLARRSACRAKQHNFGAAARDAAAAATLRRRLGDAEVAAKLDMDAQRLQALAL